VLHTHTPAGIAVSAQEHGLLPISQHAAILLGGLSYHDFEGIAVDEVEQASLVRDLGPNRVMILRNHGLLTAGRSAGETLQLMLVLERACQAQVAALAGGRVRSISPAAQDATTKTLNSIGGGEFGRDWAAMLRLVERVSPDYRN
jgi:ribulose-5-phosphate 4-epimerase/fuculose-1-phosphate aldolase